jgi:hypothetical protein
MDYSQHAGRCQGELRSPLFSCCLDYSGIKPLGLTVYQVNMLQLPGDKRLFLPLLVK